MDKYCVTCGQRVPEFGGIIADPERSEVRFGGKVVYLQRPQFEMFALILSKRGRVVTKDIILEHLYQLRPEADIPEIDIIDVILSKLRYRIGILGLEIGTAWGRGVFMREPGGSSEPRE